MTNDASYVPAGRDNTGAATVLSPFNQQQIWSSYDKRENDFDKQLKDSFGRPLNYQGAKVHPNDIPVIRQKVMDYEIAQAKAIQQAKATHTNITPEKQQELLAMKMEAQDTISLAQQQLANAEKQQEEIRKNPWLYPQGALQQFDQHFLQPIGTRPYMYTAEKLPTDDLNKWIRDNASGSWKKVDKSYKNADGSSSSRKETVFSEEDARRAYNKLIAPNINTPKGQQLTAIVQPLIEKAAQQTGIAYADMSPEQQAEVSHKVMEDYVVDQMRLAKEGLLETSVAEADPEKAVKIAEKKKGEGIGMVVGRVFMPVQKSGERKRYSGETSDRLEVLESQQFPIRGRFGDNKPMENNALFWSIPDNEDGKTQVIEGKIISIQKYRGAKKGNWDKDFSATVMVKDSDGKFTVKKEIPLNGYNLQTFKSEFKIDPATYRDKHYPNWQNQLDKLQDTPLEDIPEYINGSEQTRKYMEDAYARYKGTSSTPAPALEKWKKEFLR